MSKGWGRAAVAGVVVLMYADALHPGTAGEAVDNTKKNADKVLDSGSDTLSEHVIPAASDTLGAARDGLAETNILGSEQPTWAQPQDGG